MWNVNGRYTFLAQDSGASAAKGVDVMQPTDEFERQRAARDSRVEFIQGDVLSPETLRRIGPHDVVFSAGVLYHHPSPYELVLSLRELCEGTLILRTSTVPENSKLLTWRCFGRTWPLLSESCGARRAGGRWASTTRSTPLMGTAIGFGASPRAACDQF